MKRTLLVSSLAIACAASCSSEEKTPSSTGDPGDADAGVIGDPLPPPEESLEIASGENWSLPDVYPTKSPYGGLYQIWGTSVRWSPYLDMGWVGGMWKDLNPSEGVYAWNKIESISTSGRYGLDELGENGRTAILWLNIGLYSEANGWAVPQWVFDKCEDAGTPVSIVRNGTATWGAALWQPCPRAELFKFIREMFGRYKDDPRLAKVHVTSFNAGEFWMPAAIYQDALAKGLDEATLKSYGKGLIDTWVETLGADKVVWTSTGWKSAAGGNWVCDYAVNTIGTDLREGLAESVSGNLDAPLIGRGWDDDYYFENQPIEDMGRDGIQFFGDEFELGKKYAGVFDNYPYYRLAVLNMLKKGINWAIFPPELRGTDNDEAHPEFAMMRDYFRRSAGYPRHLAPDAWSVLLMMHDDCYNGTRKFKNYEKFMIQREVEPDGKTRLVEKKTWAPDQFGFCAVGTGGAEVPAVTYFARATDHASGSDYIYFDVHDEYAADHEHYFQIAVYYRDVGTATWHIQYSTADEDYRSTMAVTNTDDGEWKTAVFTLPDVHLRNAQTEGKDFRIYNGGSEDVVVGSVRLIRLPSTTTD